MSTFSLVGAVMPVAAAGSLFAGFMSVTNLGYSASYASGAWLYAQRHGGGAAARRAGAPCSASAAGPGDKLSLQMLILIGSARVLRELPRRARAARTRARPLAADETPAPRARSAGSPCRPGCDGRRTGARWSSARLLLALLTLRLKFDPVASVLTTFLGVCLMRKSFLDALLRRRRAAA